MNEWDLFSAMNDIDPQFILEAAPHANKTTPHKKLIPYLRLFRLSAACLALFLAIALLLPSFFPDSSEKFAAPQVRSVAANHILTGPQSISWKGEAAAPSSNAATYPPRFQIQTVIEAEVVEVLPDAYSSPINPGTAYHVVRLRVLDAIRGKGLPDEIYLEYYHYGTDIFDGYDSFILSLKQFGLSDYPLINNRTREYEYFPHMFEVMGADLGYGSVIALNDGVLDESFWEKANRRLDSRTPLDMISPPYIASANSTRDEIRASICEEAETNPSALYSDYVSNDEVFATEETLSLRPYLSPSDGNLFVPGLISGNGGYRVLFIRVLLGFRTDEEILLDFFGETVSISRRGEAFTAEDCSSLPDLSAVLSALPLTEVEPPNLSIPSGARLSSVTAGGNYYKVNGKVYGVVAISWFYVVPNGGKQNKTLSDTLYLLYDNESGRTVSLEELMAAIGDSHRAPLS